MAGVCVAFGRAGLAGLFLAVEAVEDCAFAAAGVALGFLGLGAAVAELVLSVDDLFFNAYDRLL